MLYVRMNGCLNRGRAENRKRISALFNMRYTIFNIVIVFVHQSCKTGVFEAKESSRRQ